jgi:uncharacterized membrane protein YcfT
MQNGMQNVLPGAHRESRVDWVDYAKGFCIVFVVMMHSTLGVEGAAGQDGWLHPVVEFARPFRMPDFFMISGLFLANVINRDWRTYLDRKVVHFAYFYLLWMTIQFVFKAPGIAASAGVGEVVRLYLVSLIDPFGTLWFIYLLPIFFVFVKLTKRVPVPVLWLAAAALEIAPVHTGWMVIDEFAARFVYFYTGYVLARHIFSVAADVQAKPWKGVAMLTAWGIANGALVYLGYADLPFVSLALGLIGAAAVIRLAALLSLHDIFKPLRYCGRNSIVIYLAFFLPMAASRAVLLKTGYVTDIGTISVLVTLSGIFGALILYWIVRHTPLKFLFERPAMFWLVPEKPKARPQMAMQPAE